MSKSTITSEAVTEGIRIKAIAEYMSDYSNPDDNRFMYSYHITITNEGTEAAKLVSRHWIIINSYGDRQDVCGPGVVGETPSLEPGDTFQYTSFCPLDTNFGTMEGSYKMEREDGKTFDAEIKRFYLATTMTPSSQTKS